MLRVLLMRQSPARIGATVVILFGEGYSPRRGGPRPRAEARFLGGEFGVITGRTPDWYREWTVTLPPHPDYPEDGEREFMFQRSELYVCPPGTVPNTSAMDNHPL